MWDYPPMTTRLDTKHRAVIKLFHPGDVLKVESQGEDVVVLRRMKPAANPKPKLVRKKSGDLVFAGGRRITSKDVRRMLEGE